VKQKRRGAEAPGATGTAEEEVAGGAAGRGNVQANDVVQRVRKEGGEVIINSAKFVAEGCSLLEALFNEGLGVGVESPETTEG
jgi:hydrogenase maturation factor